MSCKLESVGFISGFAQFFFGGIVAIFIGVVLCLTVIGAIVGIPMVIAGVVMIGMSPFAFKFAFVGDCPHCATKCRVLSWKKVLKCKGCKKRIKNNNGYLSPLL